MAARKWIETGDGFLPSASVLISLARTAQSDAGPKGDMPAQEYREELDRKQAELAAILVKLWGRKIPEHELALVPEKTFRSAMAEGSCMIMRNGARRYRTAETLAEFERQRVNAKGFHEATTDAGERL